MFKKIKELLVEYVKNASVTIISPSPSDISKKDIADCIVVKKPNNLISVYWKNENIWNRETFKNKETHLENHSKDLISFTEKGILESDIEDAIAYIIKKCENVFNKKLNDYGCSWRVLRNMSILDQIFIKIKRIREIEIKNNQLISDPIKDDYIGLINYSIIGLIQLELGISDYDNISIDIVKDLYIKYVEKAITLLEKKNHDYGNAWQDMEISSITDLIYAKTLRAKQIIKNNNKTEISEGLDSNYYDILNYSIFSLIKLK